MGEHLNFFLYITRAPTSHLIWATRASYVRGVFLRHKLFLSRQIWYTVAAKQILQRMTYKLFPFIIQIHSIILSQSIFGFGIKHVAIVFLKTLRQKLQWKKKKKGEQRTPVCSNRTGTKCSFQIPNSTSVL
jgi:hypothetical protein